MLRRKHVIFLLLAAVILYGCSAPAGDLTDYAAGGFTALISGRSGEVEFSAVLTMSPTVGESDRSFSLSLTSPESLEGMRVEGDFQSVSVYLGDLRLYNGAIASLPSLKWMIEAFSPSEEPISVSAVKGSELQLSEYDTVTVLRFSFGLVFLDPDGGDPIMIKALPRGEGFYLEFTVDSFTE